MSLRKRPSTADGSGAILGVAAGEQLAASSASRAEAYGFATQHMTLFAYHLLRHGGLNQEHLRSDLLGSPEPGSLAPFRSPPPWFAELAASSEWTSSEPSPDPVVRLVPLAVWHRWDADRLAVESLDAMTATHSDRRGVVAAGAYAGAVAAASFGQQGIDFLNASRALAATVAEAESAASGLTGDGPEPAAIVSQQWLELPPADVFEAAVERDPRLGVVGAAIALGGHGYERSIDVLRSCSALDPWLSAMVGGIAGARQGLGRWPWAVANETWFTEIGVRIAAHRADLDDLPDPHAVEMSLSVEGDEGRVF